MIQRFSFSIVFRLVCVACVDQALTWLHRQTDPFVRETEEFRCLEQARQAAGLDGVDVAGSADAMQKKHCSAAR
jgi:hypothetical protein